MAFNVVRITNENGQVVGTREYDAFGNILSETGDWSMCPFGFQPNWIQLKDVGDGRFYLTPGGRIYDTKDGRFLQRDPKVEGGENRYVAFKGNPLKYLDPDGCGIVEWILTGKWDPTEAELAAATRGWIEGFGQLPWDPEESLGQWLYTGELEATEKELEAALGSREMAQYVNCYLECLGCETTRIVNLAGAAFTSFILHAGVPKKFAEFLAGQAGGVGELKSLFNVLAIRLRQIGLGRAGNFLSHYARVQKLLWRGKEATAATKATAVARVGTVAACILAIHVAQKCMRACLRDPCYDCSKEKRGAPELPDREAPPVRNDGRPALPPGGGVIAPLPGRPGGPGWAPWRPFPFE
jgi:RHS repeat-associated protein